MDQQQQQTAKEGQARHAAQRSAGPADIHLLARLHGEALYRWALRLRRDPTDAWDLLQDTYERALRSGPAPAPQHARAWLFVIMKNLFLDQCRARRRRGCVTTSERIADLPAVDEGGDPEPPWANLGTDEVRRCLAGLDRAFREVYTLHALEGLSYAEIAARLRLSPRTIGTRIFRARQKLRQALCAHLERSQSPGGEGSRADRGYVALAA